MGIPEWLISTAAPGTDEAAPEYLRHAWSPRFICRVVDTEEEEEPLGGFAFAVGDWVLCDFEFIDEAPVGETLDALLRRVMAAIG